MTTRTTRVEVSGELDIDSLYELVARAVPDAPESATINLHVTIPGGGDWSNTDLDLDLRRTVKFTVTWTEET